MKEESGKKQVELSFHGTLETKNIKAVIFYEPFRMEVYKENESEEILVFSTLKDGSWFLNTGMLGDYKIIQRVKKLCTAKYVGFGEQGDMELMKNSIRVTYFNYDNMRYRQVYNQGPFEERETLYHSEP